MATLVTAKLVHKLMRTGRASNTHSGVERDPVQEGIVVHLSIQALLISSRVPQAKD